MQGVVRDDTIEDMIGPMPKVPQDYNLYLNAFYKLNTERQLVQGTMGCIPVSKIMEYADWLDYDDSEEFVAILSSIDNAYIKNFIDSLKKQTEK